MAINSDYSFEVKENLVILIEKIKVIKPDLGAYVEHFGYSGHTIIVKLTNGFLKVNESILTNFQDNGRLISDMELHKIGITFERTQL
jgi:hypothetical protein